MVVAVAFLCLAVAGGAVSFSEWRDYRHTASTGPIASASASYTAWYPAFKWLVAGFTVLLVIFSLYSFAKARSVR
jgi:hypothetical protein